MAMACKVCNHPKRIEVDRLLVSGKSVRKIASQYDLPYKSVYRHRNKHISRQLVKSQEVRDSLTGKHLLNVVQDVLENCQRIMCETGHDPKQYNISLIAAGKVLSVVQLLHEISTNLLEYQTTEIEQKQTSKSEEYMVKLNRLSVDEMRTLRNLQQKMLGHQPGKRTDIILKRKKEEARQRYRENRERKKSENQPRKPTIRLRRRKIEPKKPENEFDAMRKRLNIANES